MLSVERKAALTEKADRYAANIAEAEPYLLSRGISREAGEMFRLGCVPYGDEYAGRLSIPYVTPTGVVNIKYRCADVSHQPDCRTYDCVKYYYESGIGHHLNARVLIQTPGLVVVTEGELDAVVIQAYCGTPAVAYPGVGSWKKFDHWPLCFEGVGEVVVVADNDDEGKSSAERVADSVGQAARVLRLPKWKDGNEYIHREGHQAFEELLAK